MDGGMGWRRNVALGGDRRSGGSPAGRRDWQAVQEIIVRSEPAGELNERKSMLVKLFTGKIVSETGAALQAAVQASHFGVMQVHNLKETMTKKGVEFARECLIFEVCQPQQAKKVLDQNMSVSTALPCRISIYEEGGKTILATLKPTTLLAMFNTPQLKGVAQEVEATIVKIMKEAASG
jgi:uncharacterized protein (DUF302 family)